MDLPTGDCPRCGCGYQIMPDYAGNFTLACECPPMQTRTTNNTGVYVLEPDEFDRVMHDLQNPAAPTESIKRGAELIRKLYGKK